MCEAGSIRNQHRGAQCLSRCGAGTQQETVKVLSERLQQAVDAGRIAGAVAAVTNRQETLWAGAFGDVQPDTIFYIASSSKPLAATTIILQAPPDDHTRQLLSHSGGIFGNDTKDPVERDLLRNAGRTLAEAAAGIAARPLICAPGEGTVYSDA